MPKLVGATSTSGYFQPHPKLYNALEDDPILDRSAKLFLPEQVYKEFYPHLHALCDLVIDPKTYALVANAEHDLPYIKGTGFSSFGHPIPDALVTSPGWKELQNIGIRNGIVATGYDSSLGASARVAQFLKLHQWGPSSAVVTCPSAMQDGATSVLLRELQRIAPGSRAYDDKEENRSIKRKVFTRAVERLLSLDPEVAWTSGQWMTERPGGSDVAGTETVATYEGDNGETDIDGNPLGPWCIDGFKWFSSATDCGCVLLLAQTEKGLGCFFAPTRKLDPAGDVAMNGIRIQRLKNKLGTKALPTAEVEVKGMRAWLVGTEGRGVANIATLLNVTRLYNAGSSTGFWGRGLAIARSFGRQRVMPSLALKGLPDKLRTLPRYTKTIAGITLGYRADTLLAVFVAALVGKSENPDSPTASIIPTDHNQVAALVRLITPVSKARTAKNGIAGLQECMESLGGVGFMENQENPEMNIARLFRDANVLSIWEGTTDVLATDTVKVVKGKTGAQSIDAVDKWLKATLGANSTDPYGAKSNVDLGPEKAAILKAWSVFVYNASARDKEELLAYGREVVAEIGDVLCATLLVADAESDNDLTAIECARRFVRTRGTFGFDGKEQSDWKSVSRWDDKISFEREPPAPKPRAKL
ncbi:Acyl-CoA dehydrogenase family member 11 [Vanrija pseudolonga]|uniref:Acyl-CoA dehydrogenase family member 11 n=1 Tax=Vanrija pseudolonga TaxID=143232 RepID=A0AAF1BLR5_9TREE|nr:Acyl-CoA dehydrogenase family member 11 [Vanrija pseudolonga]